MATDVSSVSYRFTEQRILIAVIVSLLNRNLAFLRWSDLTSMSLELNWQTARPTIRERTKFMLNNDLFSDVKFVVRKSDGESESKQVIPAHKFVLSIGSPVFEAMFYGELAETRDSIELPDCEYESLLELFRYMYSDEVNLSGSNMIGVLYLAKKYMVLSLAEKCSKYLQDNLDPANVFSILPSAQKYEEKNLVDQCWEVIDKQTEAAVKSEGFATIERSLLESVVVRDSLSIKEVNLFQAVDLWATKECARQGLAANGELKRRILGEPIIKAIRFPVMKQEEFAAVVLDKNILTKDELVTFFQFFSSTLATPLGFSDTKRSGNFGICRCGRFESDSVATAWWGYNGGSADFLVFVVDKDIMLHGVCLFGSENKDYTVELAVKDASNNLSLASKAGRFSSKLVQYKGSTYYGFEVLFDSAVNAKKDTKYQVEALITGPSSRVGRNGLSVVQLAGVKFTFSSGPQGNRTTHLYGQFAELLFSV